MSNSDATLLLVMRVIHGGKGPVIRIQDLRTGELREFTSWAALQRYAEKEAPRTKLR